MRTSRACGLLALGQSLASRGSLGASAGQWAHHLAAEARPVLRSKHPPYHVVVGRCPWLCETAALPWRIHRRCTRGSCWRHRPTTIETRVCCSVAARAAAAFSSAAWRAAALSDTLGGSLLGGGALHCGPLLSSPARNRSSEAALGSSLLGCGALRCRLAGSLYPFLMQLLWHRPFSATFSAIAFSSAALFAAFFSAEASSAFQRRHARLQPSP